MNHEIELTVRDNLRREMDVAGVNAVSLGKRSGVTPRMINYILKNERCPNIEVIAKLAKGLGIPSWKLLVDQNEPPSSVTLGARQLDSEFMKALEALGSEGTGAILDYARYLASRNSQGG